MLTKETTEQLSKFGFDVSKLIEAVKSDDEIKLEVPSLHTKDEMTTFGQNLRREGFTEGKKAISEIKAKEYKTKYSIDAEGKDLDNIVSLIIEKHTKTTPDDKYKELKTNFDDLQNRYQASIKEKEKLQSEYQTNLFQNNIEKRLVTMTPKKTALMPDDILVLYKNSREFEKDDNGGTLIKKNGEVLRDNLLNPIKLDDDFNSFLEEKKLIKKEGMGGDDTGGGTAKFKDMDSFMAYCSKNNIEPMGDEGQKLLLENKEF